MNCDGWGRDLPKNPWDDTSYCDHTMFGTVELHVDMDGSRAELHFKDRNSSRNRPISSFKGGVEKITPDEMKQGRDTHHSYEKQPGGKKVPIGTAWQEYCRRFA